MILALNLYPKHGNDFYKIVDTIVGELKKLNVKCLTEPTTPEDIIRSSWWFSSLAYGTRVKIGLDIRYDELPPISNTLDILRGSILNNWTFGETDNYEVEKINRLATFFRMEFIKGYRNWKSDPNAQLNSIDDDTLAIFINKIFESLSGDRRWYIYYNNMINRGIPLIPKEVSLTSIDKNIEDFSKRVGNVVLTGYKWNTIVQNNDRKPIVVCSYFIHSFINPLEPTRESVVCRKSLGLL